jgi:Phage terminase, small subunit
LGRPVVALKIFSFPSAPNQWLLLVIPPQQEGRIAIATDAELRDAMDATATDRDENMHGPLIKTTDGNARRNPLVKIAVEDDMLRFAGEFGLTPVARTRLASGGITAIEVRWAVALTRMIRLPSHIYNLLRRRCPL